MDEQVVSWGCSVNKTVCLSFNPVWDTLVWARKYATAVQLLCRIHSSSQIHPLPVCSCLLPSSLPYPSQVCAAAGRPATACKGHGSPQNGGGTAVQRAAIGRLTAAVSAGTQQPGDTQCGIYAGSLQSGPCHKVPSGFGVEGLTGGGEGASWYAVHTGAVGSPTHSTGVSVHTASLEALHLPMDEGSVPCASLPTLQPHISTHFTYFLQVCPFIPRCARGPAPTHGRGLSWRGRVNGTCSSAAPVQRLCRWPPTQARGYGFWRRGRRRGRGGEDGSDGGGFGGGAADCVGSGAACKKHGEPGGIGCAVQ